MGASCLRMWLAVMGILLTSLVTSGSALGQPPKDHAKARLIAEFARVMPGSTAWFGLDFEIDAGWHLYWNGVNDSGFAPKLNAKVSPGCKVGDLVWPAPHRLINPGNILDHIYEKHVTLLFPIEVPKDAKPGQELTIQASPEWLVCHEVCLPGNADLTLKVQVAEVGEKPARTPDGTLFTLARQRVPQPLAKETPAISISVKDDRATLTAKGAASIAFYPSLDCVSLPSLIKEGEKKGDRLTLSFEAQPGKKPMLRGVVEAKPSESGPPMLWSVEFDLSGVNKQAPGASDPKAPVRGD